MNKTKEYTCQSLNAIFSDYKLPDYSVFYKWEPLGIDADWRTKTKDRRN